MKIWGGGGWGRGRSRSMIQGGRVGGEESEEVESKEWKRRGWSWRGRIRGG
jgi:hypothetical protein